METDVAKALAYLSKDEKNLLDSFEKVIVWGFPLDTHTHSYVHACWVKTFKALGKPTFWFHDKEFEDPSKFSYKNCLFITEGFQDEHIPLDSSNIYFIHFCIYPQKYLRAGARFFEIRFKVEEFHDCNNDWNLKDGSHKIMNLSEDVFYEALTSDVGIAPEFRGPNPTTMSYEAVYMQWPTDLLPWEIDLKDAEREHHTVVHYVGTPYGNPRLEKFKEVIAKRGIEFISHNPWEKPVSFEDAKEFVQQSCLAPDFRPEGNAQETAKYGEKNGKNHLAIGYIPCRLFKNISYGHIPLTDSPHAAELFGDAVVFEKDIEKLVEKGLEAQKDIDRKRKAMRMVAERHTYLHRARDLLRAILMPRPLPSASIEKIRSTWNQVTIVTSLIDIKRDQIDGRKFDEYVTWFAKTLTLPAPMVIFLEPSLVGLVQSLRGDLPTKIVPQNFMETPLAWSTPYIEQIQNSIEWREYAKHPKDLTNCSAPYVTLMHDKAVWLWNIIEENPFGTDLFFWMDAGLSRFWQGMDPLATEPHPRFLRNLRRDKKIYCQVGGFKEELLRRGLMGPKFTTDELIGHNENIIMGGFYGGPASIVKQLCEFSMRFYIRELLQKHRVDNDQPTIFFHVQENPHMYAFVPPYPDVGQVHFLLMALGKIME